MITIAYVRAIVVMVTAKGNGHGDQSSNPGQDYLHST